MELIEKFIEKWLKTGNVYKTWEWKLGTARAILILNHSNMVITGYAVLKKLKQGETK